jgi:NADH-quinone oxidoreductase subunit M
VPLFADHLLSWITFLPLAGTPLVLLAARRPAAARAVALAVMLADLALSLVMLAGFASDGGDQFVERAPWLAGGRISYALAVDGISLFLVLLTTVLCPLVVLSSWRAIADRVAEFLAFLLLLQTAMLGTFLARDMLLFYVFWEAMLIPMGLIIGIWGGERRVYAAVKFFIFTMAGSVIMLLAILYLGLTQGTFSMPWLAANRQLFIGAQTWLFLAFALAFAVKAPIFPLHTWLPDAYTEAPAAVTVILAAVLSKLGTYGFLRINLPLFPQASAQFAPWIGLLAVIGILYGALVAYHQTDLKRLIAYSSISHLGFVILGIFALNPQGVTGAVLQMVNHGLSTGALFFIVGLLEERRGTRSLSDFGGLWKAMPVLGGVALVVVLSSAGLPGLNGFVGELTILLGAFGSQIAGALWLAVAATVGVILAAVYLLRFFEKIFLGPLAQLPALEMPDAKPGEIVLLAPLLVFIFWIGLYPAPFLNLLNPTLNQLSAAVLAAAGLR